MRARILLAGALLAAVTAGCSIAPTDRTQVCGAFDQLAYDAANAGGTDNRVLDQAGELAGLADRYAGTADLTRDASALGALADSGSTTVAQLRAATTDLAYLCGHPVDAAATLGAAPTTRPAPAPETVTVTPSAPAPETTTVTAPEPAAADEDPRAVVTEYLEALQRKDYTAAWQLGARNMHPSYDGFVAKVDNITAIDFSVYRVSGSTASVHVTETYQNGGSNRYDLDYGVAGGAIVSRRAN